MQWQNMQEHAEEGSCNTKYLTSAESAGNQTFHHLHHLAKNF